MAVILFAGTQKVQAQEKQPIPVEWHFWNAYPQAIVWDIKLEKVEWGNVVWSDSYDIDVPSYQEMEPMQLQLAPGTYRIDYQAYTGRWGGYVYGRYEYFEIPDVPSFSIMLHMGSVGDVDLYLEW